MKSIYPLFFLILSILACSVQAKPLATPESVRLPTVSKIPTANTSIANTQKSPDSIVIARKALWIRETPNGRTLVAMLNGDNFFVAYCKEGWAFGTYVDGSGKSWVGWANAKYLNGGCDGK